MTHIAIIGGGISGLSAAWYAQQAGLTYTLIEQSDRWGGKVKTSHESLPDGGEVLVEHGPDSFITVKPWALQLVKELGLEAQLLPANEARNKVYVLRQGKLVALPDGVMMVVPTKILPFALTSLFTPLEKLRMGLDIVLPPKRDSADESVAAFIHRRLGAAVVDRLAEPLMSGIYNADAQTQSLLATFPRFREIEQQYGSLILGMLAASKRLPVSQGSQTPKFISLVGGMSDLVGGLLGKLRGDLRLNTGVRELTRDASGKYHIKLSHGGKLQADAVLLAVPAYAASELVNALSPRTAELLCNIEYVDTGVLTLAYRRSDVPHPLDGTGVTIPRSENRPINALTWTTSKLNYRAPDDVVLIRVFYGGARRPDIFTLSDKQVTAIARAELRNILGIEAAPVGEYSSRWKQSTPQYKVGHLELLRQIEETLPEGIHVIGAAYRGIGLPDCIKQARDAVQHIEVSVSPEEKSFL